MGILSNNDTKALALVDKIEQFFSGMIEMRSNNITETETQYYIKTKAELQLLILKILNHEPLATVDVVKHKEEDEL